MDAAGPELVKALPIILDIIFQMIARINPVDDKDDQLVPGRLLMTKSAPNGRLRQHPLREEHPVRLERRVLPLANRRLTWGARRRNKRGLLHHIFLGHPPGCPLSRSPTLCSFFSSFNPPFYAALVIINYNSFRMVPFFHSENLPFHGRVCVRSFEKLKDFARNSCWHFRQHPHENHHRFFVAGLSNDTRGVEDVWCSWRL